MVGDHLNSYYRTSHKQKPNSPSSGYVIGEMEAGDSYENLKKAFGSLQVRKKVKSKRKSKIQKNEKKNNAKFRPKLMSCRTRGMRPKSMEKR